MLEALSLYLFSCVHVPKGGFFKRTYVHPAKLGIPVMTFAAIPLKNSRSNLAEFEFEYYCLHCVLSRNVWRN